MERLNQQHQLDVPHQQKMTRTQHTANAPYPKAEQKLRLTLLAQVLTNKKIHFRDFIRAATSVGLSVVTIFPPVLPTMLPIVIAMELATTSTTALTPRSPSCHQIQPDSMVVTRNVKTVNFKIVFVPVFLWGVDSSWSYESGYSTSAI
jgi:hypothetical protein